MNNVAKKQIVMMQLISSMFFSFEITESAFKASSWLNIARTSACLSKTPVILEVLFPSIKPLGDHLVSLIDNETKSISFAMYAFNNFRIVDALQNAHKRGVLISGVVDSKTLDLCNDGLDNAYNLVKFLKKYDIQVSESRRFGCMHNKIFCFESNKNYAGPVVCTGSANATKSGLEGVSDQKISHGCSRNNENMITIYGSQEVYSIYRDHIEYLRKEILKYLSLKKLKMKKRVRHEFKHKA